MGQLLSEITYHTINNYLLCFFVTTATTNALSIADIAYEMSWYQASQYENYVIQMVIMRSQEPFELTGLGVFVCSLGTFLKVFLEIGPEKFLFDPSMRHETCIWGTTKKNFLFIFKVNGDVSESHFRTLYAYQGLVAIDHTFEEEALTLNKLFYWLHSFVRCFLAVSQCNLHLHGFSPAWQWRIDCCKSKRDLWKRSESYLVVRTPERSRTNLPSF